VLSIYTVIMYNNRYINR